MHVHAHLSHAFYHCYEQTAWELGDIICDITLQSRNNLIIIMQTSLDIFYENVRGKFQL